MLLGKFSLRKVLFLVCLAPKRNILSSNPLSIFNLRSIIPMPVDDYYCGFSMKTLNSTEDFY